MAKIEEKVEQLVKLKIEQLGYELYDVEYSKQGKDNYLRIFIDQPKGIDLNDCEKVNNGINELLEQADYLKDSYFLEVSSPGIERIIRKEEHLQKNIGVEINVKLFQKNEQGKKELQGILQAFSPEEIVLKQEEDQQIIQRKNIAQIKTIYHWD